MGVIHCVDMCIIRIRVGYTQCSYRQAHLILKNHRVGGIGGSQYHGTGCLVDIRNSEGESLCCGKSAAIRGSYGNLYRLRRFVVKTFTIFKFKLAIHHFKMGVIHCVDVCITCIRVGHTQHPNDGSHLIFVNHTGR